MTGVADELNQSKAKSSSSSAATNQATSSKTSPTPLKFKLPSQRSQSLEQKSSLDKSPYSSLACKNFLSHFQHFHSQNSLQYLDALLPIRNHSGILHKYQLTALCIAIKLKRSRSGQMIGVTEELKQNKSIAKSSSSYATNQARSSKTSPPPSAI